MGGSTMETFEEIKKYSTTVCQQIRWKKARPSVATEIENHIYDQKSAYILEGFDEKVATQKAILQMGDATELGLELNKTYKPKPQWIMILLTVVLISTGMFSNYYINKHECSWNLLTFIPYIIAYFIFIACYFADFTIIRRFIFPCYSGILLLSIIGIVYGNEINGRLYWFSSNLSYLTPIYCVTFALVIYTFRTKGFMGILLCGIAYVPFAIILYKIPSITGVIIFTFSVLCMLFLAIVKGWYHVKKWQGLLILFSPPFLLGSLLLVKHPYLVERIHILIHPSFSDRGYFCTMIGDIFKQSVFIGKGTVPKQFGETLLLPNTESEFLLSILIHNFGRIILVGIIVLIILFSSIGFYSISKQKSILGILISFSIMLPIILQSLFYIGGNVGYGFPVSLPIPFLSNNSVNLMIHTALTGLMLSIFRTGSIFKDNPAYLSSANPLFSYKDGKLIIDLKARHI